MDPIWLLLRRLGRLTLWLAAGLLGLTGCAAVYTQVAQYQAESRYPAAGQRVQAEGITLHYKEAGSGQAVVLLHGASSNLREFDGNLFEGFSRTHRALSFDRPGYGYSERGEGWPDPHAQAATLRGALASLGVERPLLVGHSWSGSLVLAYALAFPQEVRGVVLLAGGSHPWRGGVAWHVALADTPVLGSLFAHSLTMPAGELMMPAALQHVFWPERVPDGYAERAGVSLALRPGSFRASAQDVNRLSSFLEQQAPRYAELAVPVMLISGTHDHVVPAWNHAARMIGQTERAELHMLQGAGHGLHHTRTARIVALVNGFAERHP